MRKPTTQINIEQLNLQLSGFNQTQAQELLDRIELALTRQTAQRSFSQNFKSIDQFTVQINRFEQSIPVLADQIVNSLLNRLDSRVG